MLRNYMIKYNISNVNDQMSQELNKFFLKSSPSNSDLLSLDKQLSQMINNKNATNNRNNRNKGNIVPESSITATINKEKDDQTKKEIVKLPTILSRSVNMINKRPESRESGMSGASELSEKYSKPDEKTQHLKILMKEYNLRKNNSVASPQGLDYETIVKNEAKLSIEEKQAKENRKKEEKNLLKKQLEQQMSEKRLRNEGNFRNSRELDLKEIKSIEDYAKVEKEKETYLKSIKMEEKNSLVHILKDEKKRKQQEENKQKQIDQETIKKILDEIKADGAKVNEKKRKDKQHYDNLKSEIDLKKKKEREELQKEKDFDQACFEDNKMMYDKLDHARYLDLTNKGANQYKKYDHYKSQSVEDFRSVKSERSSSVKEILSERIEDNDEAMLKKLQIENMKKYEELEKKVKMLEEKLEVKNKNENGQRVKITRQFNSFIGQNLNRNSSEIKKPNNLKSSGSVASSNKNNLVIKNIKDSIINRPKPISSSLFTTQIGN